MSFLKTLLGGTFDTHTKNGDALFEEDNFGLAKIAYERALSKAKNIEKSQIEEVRHKIERCKIRLATARIGEADELARQGDIDAAIELLRDVTEICRHPDILEQIQNRRETYESEDAKELADGSGELSEDELVAIIAGTWTEAQAEEYAALPDEMREAIIADHDGEAGKAAALIGEIVARDDLPVTPYYAWFELGRCRLSADDKPGALEALDTFLSLSKEKSESLEHTVAAHRLKASVFIALEEFDRAKEELLLNTRLAPEDHTTFLSLGVFLRERGDTAHSLTALHKAAELMGQMQPDIRVIRELGFTYLKMGRKKEAMASLGAVVEHLASRGEHAQFDPESTIALAKLHEEAGNPTEAADLYRHLAVGYDTSNHFFYNFEAARLLHKSGGDETLAERYLTRANELAKTDEERALIETSRNR